MTTPITTTLEQSKRLKELGLPQSTFLSFYKYFEDQGSLTPIEIHYLLKQDCGIIEEKICAAFTLSELINYLGDSFEELFHVNGHWSTSRYDDSGIKIETLYGDTPIDAVVALIEAIKGER